MIRSTYREREPYRLSIVRFNAYAREADWEILYRLGKYDPAEEEQERAGRKLDGINDPPPFTGLLI